MSEQNGRKAHQILSERYSNVPSWENTSPRTQAALEKVGESFAKLEELDASMRSVESDLFKDAQEVEAFLTEEVGTLELRPVDQLAMLKKMLGLDANESLLEPVPFEDELVEEVVHPDFEPESDSKPTLH